MHTLTGLSFALWLLAVGGGSLHAVSSALSDVSVAAVAAHLGGEDGSTGAESASSQVQSLPSTQHSSQASDSQDAGINAQSKSPESTKAAPAVDDGAVQVEGVTRSVSIERASVPDRELLQMEDFSQSAANAQVPEAAPPAEKSEVERNSDASLGSETGEQDASSRSSPSFIEFLLRPLRGLPTLLARRIQFALKLLAVACAVLMQLTPLRTVIRCAVKKKDNFLSLLQRASQLHLSEGAVFIIFLGSFLFGVDVRITSSRNTQGLESLPFFSLLISAALWLLYGALLRDIIILLPNATGAVAGASYVMVFWKHCPRDDKQRFLLSWYFRAGGILFAALLGCCCFCSACTSEAVVGLVASMVNAVSYAAPLASLRAVLREKSTALMPIEMCVGNFCCSTLWLCYGWIAEDSFIILPNLLGFCIGVAQLTLYGIFPPPARLGFSAVRSSGCVSSNLQSRFAPKERCYLGGLVGAPPGLGAGLKIQREHFYLPPGEGGVNCQSICGRGPSLPTHEELLRECGLRDPEDLHPSLAL